jgi:glycosyltransferase involved in cell wall biosynthesis
MKILLVHNYYRRGNPGGEDVVFDQETALLREAGYSIETYTRSNDELHEARWVDRWSALEQLVRPARAASELIESVESFAPDVIHAHNIFPLIGSALFSAAASRNIPVVLTLHNYRLSCIAATHYRAGRVCEDCTFGSSWSGVLRGCYRGSRVASAAVAFATGEWNHAIRTIQQAAVVIALSKFAASRLIENGIPPGRVFIKPNFVDAVAVPSVPFNTDGYATDDYVVFAGRLSEEKGVLDLVVAWRQMSGLKLKILGDGPLRESIQRMVATEALNIELLGMLPREQAWAVMSRALCQIVPSRWFEGMPLVVLEAWSVGVPVIATRLGGLDEMLGEDERGLTFEAGNVAELVSRISLIRTSPLLRERLRVAGLAASEAYSRATSLRLLQLVYSTALARATSIADRLI